MTCCHCSDCGGGRCDCIPVDGEERTNLSGSAGAVYDSEDDRFRYILWRQSFTSSTCMEKSATFVMLNPSTATELELDPTVRRCWSFASAIGCSRLEVVNLFAFRATKPRDMLAMGAAAIGRGNDEAILLSARRASIVICAWGTHGAHLNRGRAVLELLASAGVEAYALRRTKAGHPEHPLYIPSHARPFLL